MSDYKGSVVRGLRAIASGVQKWLLMPVEQGNVTQWSAAGFALGDQSSAYDHIFVVEDIRMLFETAPRIEVTVRDEHGWPLPGVKVEHGWPSSKWPEFDEAVMRVTDDAGKVEWVIFSEFDPMTDIGPLWVQLHGYLASDVVMGMGKPANFAYQASVAYQIDYRRVILDQAAR